MRIILTGGGTGGHIYPAIAIAQAIRQEWPETEFLYVGTEQGLESRIASAAGLEFAGIDVVGWQRKISLQALQAGWKAVLGFRTAARVMRSFSPDMVIGTGGYVCLPVVLAAARRGILTFIHEQNALPGLTNKFLSRWVDGVFLTFDGSQKHFPKKSRTKLYLAGLPVRPAILAVTRAEGLGFFGFSAEKKTLLVVGGSRGARSINQAMIGVLKKYLNHPKIQILHLTGAHGYQEFMKGLELAGIDLGNCGNIIIRPYLHEMEYALACTDLCIARAGAAFLSEMTALGIPGILSPYPYATENHQEFNARSLVERGAAEMILDRELSSKVLIDKIEQIIFDEKKRKEMSKNSGLAGKPAAIEKILDVIKRHK